MVFKSGFRVLGFGFCVFVGRKSDVWEFRSGVYNGSVLSGFRFHS